MTCDELLRQWADFGDGALPEALCEELRQHMAGCGSCAELQSDFQALARLCHECPPPRLPEDVRRRLEERLGSGGSGSGIGSAGARKGSD